MPWTEQTLGLQKPPELDSIIESGKNIAETVTTILDIPLDLLTTLEGKYPSSTDIVASATSELVDSIISEIQDLIDSLFNTGFHFLEVNPKKLESPRFDLYGIPEMTPTEAITAAIESLDDLGDDKRPQFPDTASVSGLGFLISAPEVKDFYSAIVAFLSLFQFPDLSEFVVKLAEIISKFEIVQANELAGNTENIKSKLPDWKSLNFGTVEPFQSMRKGLHEMVGSLRGYVSSGSDDIIGDLVELLNSVIDPLRELVKSFEDIIALIESASTSGNIAVLDIPDAVGGNTYIQDQLASRDFSLDSDDRSSHKYSFFVLLIGGTELPEDLIGTNPPPSPPTAPKDSLNVVKILVSV